MSGTDTVWIAWDCQSSQQLPNINYSPLRRSRVFPSPFNTHSLALQSRELGRGASADPWLSWDGHPATPTWLHAATGTRVCQRILLIQWLEPCFCSFSTPMLSTHKCLACGH